jgi:hypothetical protein
MVYLCEISQHFVAKFREILRNNSSEISQNFAKYFKRNFAEFREINFYFRIDFVFCEIEKVPFVSTLEQRRLDENRSDKTIIRTCFVFGAISSEKSAFGDKSFGDLTVYRKYFYMTHPHRSTTILIRCFEKRFMSLKRLRPIHLTVQLIILF